MKRSYVFKLLFLPFFLLAFNSCFAQDNFTYKASLDTIAQSGFYNISLSPTVIAKCKKNLEDVRIKVNTGKEVPYLIYTEAAQPNEDAFTEFPISFSENRSAVIINNILMGSLDKLFLLIKNSEAQRTATLSGSDDTLHWFIIKENIVLQKEYPAGKDVFVQSVQFPSSNYKYFRITMEGKHLLPLNIVKAGVYRHSFTSNVYDSLPSPLVLQKDSSDKRSYIYLSFNDNYLIDKLVLFFSGAKYYKRNTILYNKNTISAPLLQDTLSSEKPASIEFGAKTNRLLLVINNGDNAPLSFQKVMAFELHTSVTAYLEKGAKYSVYFGDASAFAPSYDLQYFSDSIGSNIQSLAIKNIEKISGASDAKSEKSFVGKGLLWAIILVVLLLLVYFSITMIKDINNKNKTDAHL
ncbi:MAG: hypothetical protein M3R72_08945 [Bacteroidota bacterium]|nr:hypothetical protein [Bacteroidota bacterium]